MNRNGVKFAITSLVFLVLGLGVAPSAQALVAPPEPTVSGTCQALNVGYDFASTVDGQGTLLQPWPHLQLVGCAFAGSSNHKWGSGQLRVSDNYLPALNYFVGTITATVQACNFVSGRMQYSTLSASTVTYTRSTATKATDSGGYFQWPQVYTPATTNTSTSGYRIRFYAAGSVHGTSVPSHIVAFSPVTLSSQADYYTGCLKP